MPDALLFDWPTGLKVALGFGVLGYFFVLSARHQQWALQDTMRLARPDQSLSRHSFSFLFQQPKKPLAKFFLFLGWVMTIGGPAVGLGGALITTMYGNQ